MARWIGVLGLAACSGHVEAPASSRTVSSTTSWTSCPGGFYSGPVSVAVAEVSCRGDVLQLLGETVGWASGGFLFVQETGGDPADQHAEEHLVLDTAFDPCGEWCTIEQRLAAGAADPVRDESTAFPCADDGRRTYAVGVNDPDGQFADCVVWGHDPEALISGGAAVRSQEPSQDLGACRILEATGG